MLSSLVCRPLPTCHQPRPPDPSTSPCCIHDHVNINTIPIFESNLHCDCTQAGSRSRSSFYPPRIPSRELTMSSFYLRPPRSTPQKVYKADLFPSSSQPPVLLKHRFPKKYRHPTLDSQLTRARVTSEARCLVRAARGGVTVPGLRGVEAESGVVAMEWVEGWSVREVMGAGEEGDELPVGEEVDESEGEDEDANDEAGSTEKKGWEDLDLGEWYHSIAEDAGLCVR